MLEGGLKVGIRKFQGKKSSRLELQKLLVIHPCSRFRQALVGDRTRVARWPTTSYQARPDRVYGW